MRLTIGENEGAILELLNDEGELSSTELAELSALPAGSARAVLAQMVKKGWVKLREVESDHKTLIYLITDLGLAARRAWYTYSTTPGAN